MKVKDLIKQLKKYNQEADVFVNSNYSHIGFTLAYGGGDGVEKEKCETVSIYPNNLDVDSTK
jgi:serine protease inhibitor